MGKLLMIFLIILCQYTHTQMERSPLITWLFHLRAISLLVCLLAVDFFFVRRSWASLSTRGPSVEIVFGLEVSSFSPSLPLSLPLSLSLPPSLSLSLSLSFSFTHFPSHPLQYAIMLLNAINTFAVYILHCINLYSDNSWENKPIYVRYVDIVLGKW